MVRPHYVTQRVGNEYVLVRVDPLGHLARVVAGGVGVALVSRSFRRGGLLSCAAGAALLYHAFTGRDPLSLVCTKNRGARHGEEKDSPSFPGEAESKQVASDPLEEASMESFPASDPPASMHSTTPRE